MNHKEFTQSAEELLFSPEFQELRGALEFREPNLWHIVGISRSEIRISRFLAWLLDPKAGHSFEDQFLKRLVAQALQTDTGRQRKLTPVDILVMDLTNVEVRPEYRLGNRRCDIAAFTPATDLPQNKGFLCLIENKIGAKEGVDQTSDYYEISRTVFSPEEYPHRVYIYLTPEGDPPQDEHFIPLSYQAVLKIIEDLQLEPQVTDTEQFLLQQFRENTMRGVAMDQATLDLAQAIYDEYRHLFEFIIENVDRATDDDSAPIERTWDGKSRFFNIGEKSGSGYRWEDCRQYSFICAGGGERYRKLMEKLKVGDLIYAYVSGWGYVGVGTITRAAVPFRDATLTDGRPLSDLELTGQYDDSEDDDMCDWIVLIDWEYCVKKNQAVREEFISRATSSRIYDHRKDVVDRVREELAKRSAKK